MDTFRAVVAFLANLGLVISLVTYYLSWNAWWSVKHESSAAAAVSLSSNIIYLVPLATFTSSAFLDGSWVLAGDYSLGILNTLFLVLVGMGWWVQGERTKGPFRLLAQSLARERKNVGNLAKALVHPAQARSIVHLLADVARLDAHVDGRERAYIERFAAAWAIPVDWEAVGPGEASSDDGRLPRIRGEMEAYLATTPPPRQVRQLMDVITRLVGIDQTVETREELALAELTGMMSAYVARDGEQVRFEVAVVPQNQEQAAALPAVLPGGAWRDMAGGRAYLVGSYFARQYADMVSRQHHALGFFSVVLEAGTE